MINKHTSKHKQYWSFRCIVNDAPAVHEVFIIGLSDRISFKPKPAFCYGVEGEAL